MSGATTDSPAAANLPGQGQGARAGWMLLLLALALQAACLALSMPLSELLSGLWLLNTDNPYHIYQLELGRALQADGRGVGYDPFFAAGYVGGLPSNVSARLSLLFAYLLPGTLSAASVYAVYVAVCSLLAPAALWGLARVLAWSLPRSVAAMLVGLALWWIGIAHWYHTAGMVSFVCACYVTPWYVAWTFSCCDSGLFKRPVSLLGAGLAGGLGLWLHPLFCIPATLLFLSFLLFRRRGPLPVLLGRGLVVAVVAVIVNLPWVLALMRFSGHSLVDQPYQKAVGWDVLLQSVGVHGGAATGAWINLLVLAACVWGVWWTRKRGENLAGVLAATGAFLLLFSAFAGLSQTLGQVQPNRFLIPAYLLLGLSAACQTEAVMGWRSSGHSTARTLVLLMAGTAVALLVGREWMRELQPGPHGHHGKAPPELSEPAPMVAKLQEWITANTTADTRILFQTSLGRVHGGGHMAGYLGSVTRREFLGGAYPYFFPSVSCWDKSCFGVALDKMDRGLFSRTLETYNVGWILAHSSELKRFLSAQPGVAFRSDIDGIAIYEIAAPRNFVMDGQARLVSRDFNRLEFADVGGSALTLRYHWVPGLETVPPTRIEPYAWSKDHPPLIRIIDPPPSFMLRMGR